MAQCVCRIGTPEVAYLVGNVSKIYSPELTVGTTPVRSSTDPSVLVIHPGIRFAAVTTKASTNKASLPRKVRLVARLWQRFILMTFLVLFPSV